jgi:flagellar biogenesis protein FliO
MTPEALTLQTTPIITFGYVMQVIISLLVILAFIFFAAKYLLPKLKVASIGKLIQVVDRVYLEPQVTAYIIKIKKSAWLVAVSNKNIVKIDRVDAEVNE